MNKERIDNTAFPIAFIPVACVIVFYAVPLAAAMLPAFSRFAPFSFSKLYENSALSHTVIWTFKQAFLSTLLSLVIALPGAWFLSRSHTGKKNFCAAVLRAFVIVPFAMPPILVVLGFVLFFGNHGVLNTLLPKPIDILYKPHAIILSHAFYNFPIVLSLCADSFAIARKKYAAVAADLGATPFDAFRTVILPLAAPAMAASMCLVFLYCFTSFALVLVLGGGPSTSTLAVEIYRYARIRVDFTSAAVLSCVETAVCLSVFCLYSYFKRKIQVNDDQDAGIPLNIRRKTILSALLWGIYTIIAVILVICPILSVIFDSFSSLSAWKEASGAIKPLLRSCLLAITSASLSCLLAMCALSAKYRVTLMLPISSSGIVLSFGYIIMFGMQERSFALNFALLSVIHAVLTLPFTYSAIKSGFDGLNQHVLHAAADLGAGPLVRFFSVTAPLCRTQIASAHRIAAAMSIGELNVVLMLGIKNFETLPVYIYRAFSSYHFATASAAGTMLLLLVLIIGCMGCKKF
ncbi:MAG: iron ABC transporter permease [Termitinemataceae bacterium]|nr:MAG: iron ABC transporter permease [Termitinemataceae bacterium]